jgi:hypothetical protein
MLLASRIVALAGGAGFLAASFLTWYWGEGQGVRHTEIAWQGEESLAAVICMLAAIALLGVGWAWREGWLALGILELILGIACCGLTMFHIIHNSQSVVVNGRELPGGIGAGAWVGLFFSVVMIVGAILNLCSGGPDRAYLEEEDDDAPRRRRPPREDFDRDEWDESPRRRRPPSQHARRRPPRRSEQE